MSNTMKSAAFIISLFVFLLFFIGANYLLPPGPVKALAYAAGYIAALCSQAFFKHLYTRNAMKGCNVLMTLPVKTDRYRPVLIALILPAIAVLMPVVNKRSFTSENLMPFVFLLLLAVVIKLLFHISAKTLKVYITNRGFAVDGIDMRLELTVPFSYTNAAGWYPFERIENYLAYGTRVSLYQTYDMGILSFDCSLEETRQIKGLLMSKGVPERRY